MKYCFIFFISIFCFSQNLTTEISKERLELGEPNTLKINIEDLGGKYVIAPPKGKLLPFHFEITKDEITQTGSKYQRVVEFVLFEEGNFKIPEFKFEVGGNVYQTKEYQINVYNSASKKDKLYDIMPNKEDRLALFDYWYLYQNYIIIVLVFILILLIIRFLLRKRKKKENPCSYVHHRLKELDSLWKRKKKENLTPRHFYIDLIQILRSFLTEFYHIPANILLTDDLIEVIKKENSISPEKEKIIEEIFWRSDLVKFAKMISDEETMRMDFNHIREFIKQATRDMDFENYRKDV